MACSDSDYAYLRELVLAQSANFIDPSRNALFETRLTPLARLAGAAILEGSSTSCGGPAGSSASCCRGSHDDQRDELLSRRTAVRRAAAHVLPRLIEQSRERRRLRIWSAASSTGQEAYSVAMLLCEHFPELAGWDVKMIGTDISRQVVDYARRPGIGGSRSTAGCRRGCW